MTQTASTQPHAATPGPASAAEIRAVIGPFEAEVIAQILALEPTLDEVRLAYKWLRSDEHLLRGMDSSLLSGRAAQVFEVLDAEFPDFDSGGHPA
ncbi:hypothetical protein BKK79_24635 [Cupriavidus sp. USMAA2-4]|uniref:DUF2384 domain-containing protein n=1 Tax=Cupriavidus malaysiensis TaxID=367825 RepID=A0ABN4TYI0_9BURK|nr:MULTISPECIES: hypothetical protein [Cupriavidus]AOY95017.1 hypothetical protein BKK79_24635 [Cupriavidus sp. USMAA2-4]AOZ02088.1 hypothetical protein BKK81_22455 [Cupriavidus sp. USMAHM13]AOZ10523.1 hypothetical protein BKK80_33755 [Cupriavidus malaysiensis]